MNIPLNPDSFYHLYNRANGNEQLFISDENYHYFLKRYKQLICSVADTYAYCLMPNHFHFLVKIKSRKTLRELSEFQNDKDIPQLISKRFSNLFSSYAQSYNKQQGRMGSLFMRGFKRKQVKTEAYFRKLVLYIQFNPIVHGYCSSLNEWKFCSYKAILSKQKTIIKRKETIAYFDDLENFKFCHLNPPKKMD